MTPDSLKICLITGDERRADAARGQSDQDIESKLANFGGVIMIASPHTVQNIGSRHPMGLRRSDHLAALGQVRHKSTFNSRPGASQEFMQYHGGTTEYEGRLEKTKREATSSEVIDIDRGVQNGKLSWP